MKLKRKAFESEIVCLCVCECACMFVCVSEIEREIWRVCACWRFLCVRVSGCDRDRERERKRGRTKKVLEALFQSFCFFPRFGPF